MKTSIYTSLLLLSLTCCWPCTANADEASHPQAVERLYELTRMQETIETSENNLKAMHLRQEPALREHEALLRDYLEQQIDWAGQKSPLTDMYIQ